MKELDLTPEEFIMEIGEDLKQSILASIPLDDRLRGLKPEDILEHFPPEDVKAWLEKKNMG